MNIIDVVIILLAALFAWRGYGLGFVRQATSILGFLLGLVAGNSIAELLGSGLVVSLAIIAFSLILMASIAEIAGIKLRAWLHAGHLGALDRLSGAAGGILVTAAIVWIGSIVLPMAVPPNQQHLVRDSAIIGLLDRSLPPATDVMMALDDALTEHGLPSDFGNPIAISPSDALPSQQSFAGVVATAQPSVLRIEGRACAGIGTGTGYVAAEDLIVTNAHVVAGMRYPFVETTDGRRLRAEITRFDAELDIATLRVSRLGLSPLQYASSDPTTGNAAIVLGYPGGGAFTASPARVLEHFTAVSGNIFGEGQTHRSVYALHANVEPGDSGGPVLNQAGQVIGTTFARSTTTQQIGYMLANGAVQQAVNSPAGHSAGEQLRCVQ